MKRDFETFSFDGLFCNGPMAACRVAISRGATATIPTLLARIKNGATTFDELLVPPLDRPGNKSRKAKNEAKRSEMHAICMELDARKKAIDYDPR